MEYALNLAEDGRILSATFTKYATADAVQVDKLPEGNIVDYRYVDGGYIHDPLPEPEQPEPVIPAADAVTWAALNGAYQEGVDSV